MTKDHLPTVSVLALGGTIASTGSGGVTPRLTADELVASVPGLAEVAHIDADTFRQVPSPELTLVDLAALAREIDARLRRGSTGVVVTQGTNTIEETAFALDLLVHSEAPVVVTGAMRNPTLAGADGPANLLGAVRTAVSVHARGLGTVIVFADEIHAARFARKAHTQSISPFRSSPVGPIGWLSEGAVRVGARPVGRRRLKLDEIAESPPVALLTFGAGDEGLLAAAVAPAGYRAAVVEATGGGHVTARSVEELERLAARMPVVLASRTGAGEMLRHTYSFVGSEEDLARRGLISAGAMTAAHARILLRMLLAAGATIDDAREAFEALGAPGSHVRLLGGRLNVTA
jgi:L-asparaginase